MKYFYDCVDRGIKKGGIKYLKNRKHTPWWNKQIKSVLKEKKKAWKHI